MNAEQINELVKELRDFKIRLPDYNMDKPLLDQTITALELLVKERDEAKDLSQNLEHVAAVESLKIELHEAKQDERWLREMLADYRIKFDDHAVGRRIALNQFIHDLRDEKLALEKQVMGLRSALSKIGACGQSIEPDHWKFRCMARKLAQNALSTPSPSSFVRRQALENFLNHYVKLANAGVGGNWNPEVEEVVIEARKELKQ